MIKLNLLIVCIIGSLCVHPLVAQESSATPPQPAATTESLNDLLALRSRLMIEAHKLDSEIKKMASDTKVTSPAIDALRKKVEDLHREIIKTFTQIREEVEKLPEVKAKRAAIAEKEKQIEALNKKIDEPVQK
jgi:uncharacterized coiled-coil DUF342 family protein